MNASIDLFSTLSLFPMVIISVQGVSMHVYVYFPSRGQRPISSGYLHESF